MINGAYIAGFFDGDGSLSFSNYKKTGKRIGHAGFTQSKNRENFMEEIYNFLSDEDINCIGTQRKDTLVIFLHIKEQESLLKFSKNILDFSLIKKDRLIECIKDLENKKLLRELTSQCERGYKKKYGSNEEIEILKDLVNKGYNNKSIGTIMNRSDYSIAGKKGRIFGSG